LVSSHHQALQLAAQLIGQHKVLKNIRSVVANLLEATARYGRFATRPLVLLHGGAASGKTLVLAQTVVDHAKEYGWHSVVCLLNHSHKSVAGVLEQLVQLLVTQFQLHSLLPSDGQSLSGQSLVDTLHAALQAAQLQLPSHAHLLVALDDLQELSPSSKMGGGNKTKGGLAALLSGLQHAPPAGVVFLTAMRTGPAVAQARRSVETLNIGLDDNQTKWQLEDIVVPPLDASDRARLVRQLLADHGKQLSEDAFNNQMATLLKKKGASSPVYLRAACEELRLAGRYENLDRVLQSLPGTFEALFESVLSRLESSLLCNSGDLMADFCLALLCSVQGMTSTQLLDFLCQEQGYNPMDVSQAILQLEPYLSTTVDGVPAYTLSNSQMVETLTKRFGFKKGDQHQMHSLLAGYYLARCDVVGDGRMADADRRKMHGLIHHLSQAHALAVLGKLVKSVPFWHAVARVELCQPVAEALRAMKHSDMDVLACFLGDFQYELEMDPSSTLQIALNAEGHPAIQKLAQRCLKDDLSSHLSSDHTRKSVLRVTCGTSKAAAASFETPVLNCNLVDVEPSCLTHSSAGRLVAVGARDGSVHVSNADTLDRVLSLAAHASRVTCLLFIGPDDRSDLLESMQLLTGSSDGSCILWDLTSKTEVTRLRNINKRVTALAQCPSAGVLAVGTWSGDVLTYDLKGVALKPMFRMAEAPISSLSIHSGRIAIGSWDRNIHVWDLKTTDTRSFLCQGHTSSIQQVQWTSSNVLCTVDLDGVLMAWDVPTVLDRSAYPAPQATKLSEANVCTSQASNLEVAGDLMLLASRGSHSSILHRELGHPCQAVGDSMLGHPRAVLVDDVSLTVVVGHYSGAISLYALEDDTLKQTCFFDAHDAAVTHLALASSDVLLTADDHSSCIRVWRLSACYATFHRQEAILPLFEVATGTSVTALAAGANRVAFATRDASLVFSSVNGKTSELTCLWSPKQGSTVCAMKMMGKEQFLVSRQDGSIEMLTGGHKGSIAVLQSHDANWVNCVDVSSNRKALVVGSSNHSLSVWQLAKSGWRPAGQLIGHEGAVLATRFNPAGTLIGSSSMDGTARIWSATSFSLLATWNYGLRPVYGIAFAGLYSLVANATNLEVRQPLQVNVLVTLPTGASRQQLGLCSLSLRSPLSVKAKAEYQLVTTTGSARMSRFAASTSMLQQRMDNGVLMAKQGATRLYKNAFGVYSATLPSMQLLDVPDRASLGCVLANDGTVVVSVAAKESEPASFGQLTVWAWTQNLPETLVRLPLSFKSCYMHAVTARMVVLGGYHGELLVLSCSLKPVLQSSPYFHDSPVVAAAVSDDLLCIAHQDGQVAFLCQENDTWVELSHNLISSCGLRADWITCLAVLSPTSVVIGTRCGRLVVLQHRNGTEIVQVASCMSHANGVNLLQGRSTTGQVWSYSRSDAYLRLWAWNQVAESLELQAQHHVRQTVRALLRDDDRLCVSLECGSTVDVWC
jgi:telomerase protein component 1